jgi:hypothetical protein
MGDVASLPLGFNVASDLASDERAPSGTRPAATSIASERPVPNRFGEHQ